MYNYNSYVTKSSGLEMAAVWAIVSIILAIAGGVLVYCLFLNKRNDKKFKGFLGWLYDFLHFRILTLEILLKISYVVVAIFVTLSSFALIGTSFLSFLFTLVGGNLAARISFELISMMVVIARNTNKLNDIDKKLEKK